MGFTADSKVSTRSAKQSGLSTEEYSGYAIEFPPAQAAGTLGIQTVCSAIVCERDEEQFTVTVGITHALATRGGAVQRRCA